MLNRLSKRKWFGSDGLLKDELKLCRFSNANDVIKKMWVKDFFAAVAFNDGRKFFVVEINPQYYRGSDRSAERK